MRKKVIIFIVLIIIAFASQFIIRHYERIKKFRINRFPERFNIVGNKLNLELDNSCSVTDLKCYWIGFLDDPINKDTIEIFADGRKHDIPDAYGKSSILLEYKKARYDKIGILKQRAWFKHDYYIGLKQIDSLLIIDWSISNKYESEGKTDTITLVVE